MDRNFVLALALSFLVLSLWSAYTAERRQAYEEAHPELAQLAPPQEGELRPQEPGAAGDWEIPPRADDPTGTPFTAPPEPSAAAEPAPGERVRISSPLWEAEFSTRGAGLLNWRLRDYSDAALPGQPLVEVTTVDTRREVALGMPLDGLGLGDLSVAPYQLERPDAWTLVFSLKTKTGVVVRRTYRLQEDSYLFRVLVEVENGSDRHLRPTFRTVWPARRRETSDHVEQSLAAYVEDDFEQHFVRGARSFFGRSDDRAINEPLQWVGNVDWVGAETRYFLAAMIPDTPRDAAARMSPSGVGDALAEVAFQPVNLPPGQSVARELRVYLGPKESKRLEAVGSHVDEAVLKGWFPSLSQFFVWLLGVTYGYVGNYGWAIVLITFLMRLVMAPIMARQMRSMKDVSTKMKDIQPAMNELKEKYADDRERQSQEMSKLFRESGVSPFAMMSGCLPLLLQLPVFLGLYYALQGAIELRQAPFIGWITDLSSPATLLMLPGIDLPVRPLPIMMGASMIVQQKLTPMTTMDPAQARMMTTVMPVMFTLMFYQFASGLVLYWFVSNILGILQQAWTTRGPSAAKTAATGTKLEASTKDTTKEGAPRGA